MKKYFDFLRTNISNEISHVFSYKQTFFFEVISIFLSLISQVIVIFFIYNATNGFPGWNLYEMIFLIATNGLAFSLAGFTSISMFYQNSWEIEKGYFHNKLLKPFKTQIFMLISSMNDSNWGIELIGNLIILVYAFMMLKIQVTLIGVLSFLLLIFISCLCFYGIMGILINFIFSYPRPETLWICFGLLGIFQIILWAFFQIGLR
jgi:ABC-type uncharacterized transport system permease subunit